MGQITAADKAWMASAFSSIVDDWGTTCSIRRVTRDINGQSAASAAHLTGVPVYIEGAKAEVALAMNAPVGEIFVGIVGLYTVPTQIQISDLLVTADSTAYEIVGISTYPDHLELVLTRYVQTL